MAVLGCHDIAETSDSMLNPAFSRHSITQEATFYSAKQDVHIPAAGKSFFSIDASESVWTFGFLIRGYCFETLQGLDTSFYRYELKALVNRPTFTRNFHARKPVHIIRTYPSTSAALYQNYTIERLWAEKATYSISTPCKGVVFGAVIPFEVTVTPLLKGVKVKSIKASLLETHEWLFRYDSHPLVPRTAPPMTTTIVTDNYNVPDDTEMEDINGVEVYRFTRQIQTPRSLRDCRLTLDPITPHGAVRPPCPILTIKHYLEIELSLINPDEHISIIRTNLNLILFLTPNQRLSTQLELLNSGTLPMVSNPDVTQSDFISPPLYGEHSGDEILESGSATPNTRRSRASLVGMQGRRYQYHFYPPETLTSRPMDIVPSQDVPAVEHGDLPNTAGRDLQGSAALLPPPTGEINRYSWPLPPVTKPNSSLLSPFVSGSRPRFQLAYDSTDFARPPSYSTAIRQPEPSGESNAGLLAYEGPETPPPELAS